MENDSNPPRKIFPIPSEAFGSPSILEESLISDEDYTQPLTPASARIAYNNHVFKLHRVCAINQPFRDLDSVLMKDWKDLHPRTKHHYAWFAKQGIRPVLESIAPGQGEQLWDYVKDSSIEGRSSNDNNPNEELSPAHCPTAPYGILLMLMTMHSLQTLEKRFYRCLPEILREVS